MARRHTLQVRNGRNSSRAVTFDATDGGLIARPRTAKIILPVFLLSFVIPRRALSLHREEVGSSVGPPDTATGRSWARGSRCRQVV